MCKALKNQKTCARISHGYKPPSNKFVNVTVQGKMLFQFDANRGLVRIRKNGVQHVVDLSQYA